MVFIKSRIIQSGPFRLTRCVFFTAALLISPTHYRYSIKIVLFSFIRKLRKTKATKTSLLQVCGSRIVMCSYSSSRFHILVHVTIYSSLLIGREAHVTIYIVTCTRIWAQWLASQCRFIGLLPLCITSRWQ